MQIKQRIESQLKLVREIHHSLQKAFVAPAEWVFQVHPDANHALWGAGHVATVDNFILSSVAPERVVARPGYQEKFGMGSHPTSRLEDYPPPQDVLDFMDETRASLLKALDALDDAQLQQPPGPKAPDFIKDVAGAFETVVWHEAMHMGQMTVSRRALGHRSLVQGP